MGKTELAAGEAAKKPIFVINYGLEYNLGSWTPMFAYQFAHQNNGRRTHMFGLSASAQVAGGKAMLGARYVFGKDYAKKVGANEVAVDGDVRAWTIGAAYEYRSPREQLLRLMPATLTPVKNGRKSKTLLTTATRFTLAFATLSNLT